MYNLSAILFWDLGGRLFSEWLDYFPGMHNFIILKQPSANSREYRPQIPENEIH